MQDWLGLVREHFDVVISIGSAIVAAISALAARGETIRQRQLQTERLRQSIDAASLEWGNRAIDAMGRAAMLVRARAMAPDDLSYQSPRMDLLIELSALIDQGRMFFPNLDPHLKGAEKEGAYRGKRPPILDAIMWVYHELEETPRQGGPDPETGAKFVNECRRLLVSELQAHLDPRRRDEIIGRFDDRLHENRVGAMTRATELKRGLIDRWPGLKPVLLDDDAKDEAS
jgi:hypothetical protein